MRGSEKQRWVLHPVPYLGAGIGVTYWEYEEVGDFVDPADSTIFYGRFIDSGTDFETHVLAGLELPVNDRFTFLLEGRYSWANASLGGDFSGFGDLDLGGFAAYFGMGYRF